MAITVFIFVCLQSAISVKEARDAYFISYKGSSEAKKFEQLLDSVGDNAAPVLLCYKGAAEMLKAKNAINPISKFSFFRRGKTLIEAGVVRDTSCVESRFIRFSIQRNLPDFLAYNKNVIQDSLLVSKGLHDMNDDDLKLKITEYFNRLKTIGKTKH